MNLNPYKERRKSQTMQLTFSRCQGIRIRQQNYKIQLKSNTTFYELSPNLPCFDL